MLRLSDSDKQIQIINFYPLSKHFNLFCNHITSNMPISAQYTWKDKKDTIKVLIPTKGVSPSKIDIYGKCI